MRTTLARPASLALGFILVFALAWQAWGAFIGDQIPASAVTGGGGSSSSGSLALTGVIGEPTTMNSLGGNFEVRSGLWLGKLGPNPTAVGDPALRPSVHRLIGAFPNPFNPRTEVRFELAEATRVRVDVHDVRGRLVRTLVDETRPSGPHAVMWDGTDRSGSSVASGTYYLRLAAGDRVETRKVALLK
jgi:hypothetical protein